MSQIDVSQLKTALSAIKNKRREDLNFRRADPSARYERTSNRRAVDKLIEKFFTKAGLDVDKLNKMLAEDQSELRRLFQTKKADAAKHASSIEGAIRQNNEALHQTLELLPNPNLSFVVPLDTPFLILQTGPTDLSIFRDWHIQKSNSWIKILIDTNTNTNTNGNRGSEFTFYFMWTNDSDYPAVVSAASSLVVNGACEVSAAPGFFSGHKSFLIMEAYFRPLRWTGWGTDPTTGQSLDGTSPPPLQQSQSQILAYMQAEGGREIIFGGADYKTQIFDPSVSYDLGYNWLAVPGKAVTIFEVILDFTYGIDPGGNISDLVLADFADEKLGYYIMCPKVLLEVSPSRPGRV
jgi:hypothetical protein